MTELVTLILLICLGDNCRTERIVGTGNVAGCHIYAMHVVPQVLQPGERLARVRCEAGERA